MFYRKIIVIVTILLSTQLLASTCENPAVAEDSLGKKFRYGCFCGDNHPNIKHSSTKSYKKLNRDQRATLINQYKSIDAYDDKHFILGSKDAPHKILFFSDPSCPFCKEKVVEVVDVVKKNPKLYALYYYHLPLTKIHPPSEIVSRAMLVFQNRGDIDNMLKLYRIFIEPTETDVKKILHAIKIKTGVQLTEQEINKPEITEALRVDMAMKRRLQVTGTPTIFIDGKWDRLRKEFKKYAKIK